MPNRSHRLSFIAALSSLLLLLGLAVPAGATNHEEGEASGERGRSTRAHDRAQAQRGFSVYHGAAPVTLVDASSNGHQLGDLRVTSIPTTTQDGTALGRLDATLTTTAIDVPEAGSEIRISNLVFSFGEDGQTQIVVGGSAVYPAEGATIAIDAVTVRPILGGSGRFAGATGTAQTRHLDDDSWVHTFSLQRQGARIGLRAATPQRVRGLRVRLREGLRMFDEQRRDVGGADVDDDDDDKNGHGQGKDKGQGKNKDKAEKLERFPELKAAQDEAKAAHKQARDEYKAARKALKTDKDDDEVTIVEDPNAPDADPEEVGITRIDLGVALPETAPGEQLGLWQYAIPSGSELVLHTHPGWQIARIARGELEYRVVEGEGTIIHADGTTTQIGPGVYTLATGDSVVENPALVHQGANRTDDEVIIIAATLYGEGEPLAIPVELPEEAAAA